MKYLTGNILIGVNLGLAIISALLGMPGVAFLNVLCAYLCHVGTRRT